MDYVDKITAKRAIEILQGWRSSGAGHGILFQCKNSGFITAIVTILKVQKEFLVCGPKPSTYMFKLLDGKFGVGPFARMELPEKRDSQVSGLHIYMESGSFLFIASKAWLSFMN